MLERFRADGLDVVDVSGAMGRFATREDEVDGLFRLGVFTDLYRVVRQGVRAGVESYSIKRLEPLCGYGLRVDLAEATASLIALEAALEDGDAAGDGERQRVVAGYNQDDCRATLALRDWLEGRRAELAEHLGQELPRPVFAEKPGAAEDPETARIRSALLAGVSAETSGAIARGVSAETPEGQARALLADLLDWHRRDTEQHPVAARPRTLCRPPHHAPHPRRPAPRHRHHARIPLSISGTRRTDTTSSIMTAADPDEARGRDAGNRKITQAGAGPAADAADGPAPCEHPGLASPATAEALSSGASGR